ncbi:MAG TPA: hypothetical protein VMX56_01660 [Anaerolineales bacterium]|nr:hypothetical protein [Anaerolineales bacterium]
MKNSPDFLKTVADFNTHKTYRLITLNRSGEWIAWLLVLALGILDAVLLSRLGSISLAAFIFSILFLLAASAISFSNWLDRNTKITVSESGLVYQTPMRRVAMTWQDVGSLMLTRRGAGWYVMVAGDHNVFTFQTPTSIKGPIGREARTGIDSGEQLAAVIARQADLVEIELEGDIWLCRRERSEKFE